MSNRLQRYHRPRFPPEIISHAVWRALRLWVLAYFEDEAAVPGAVGFICFAPRCCGCS